MCELTIEQVRYCTVRFEFESIVDAALMVERLRPYAPVNTKFTIKQKEQITEEGGKEDEIQTIES
jgi:hypothetical protein